MHARFHAPNLVPGSRSVELTPDESEHLGRVLRLRAGADVCLFDGRGREYEGRVELVDRSRVVVSVGRELPGRDTEPRVAVVLAQALLKGDAMDQVVRDAVMLGVSRIVPLETERCEMPAKRVKASGRVARWQRIAVSSVKQCGRTVVPEVTAPRRLEECLREFGGTTRYLLTEPALAAHPVGTRLQPGAADVSVGTRLQPCATPSVLLLVGPEGGWAPEEAAVAAAAGCQPLTLGPRTLRADAAAIVGLTALQCFFGDFDVPARARTADDWIRALNLVPHPEGGHFVETYRAADRLPADILGGRYGSPRSCSTAIYFLLRGPEVSVLHRLRSDEVWHFHAGSGARITTITPDGTLGEVRIGPDPDLGQALQVTVPAGTWFGATVDDPSSFILVGCTVSPGFSFEDFELGKREALLAAYPAHRAVIERLTRD
jgi:uncharacterized protein